jgi:tetratricopeptide (TPR) repeat protein
VAALPRSFAAPLAAAVLAALLVAATPSPAAGPAAPAAASKRYETALARYQAKDLVGALKLLQDVLVAEPGNLPARLLYARALLDGGNAVSAAKVLREALVRGAPRADVLPLLGEITVIIGDGAQLLSQPEFRDDDLPAEARRRLLLLKADVAMDGRDAPQVRRLLDQAHGLAGTDPAPWLAESRWHLRQGQPREALAACDRAARAAPASADVPFQRGVVLEALGAQADALAAYGAALNRDAAHAPARFARARLQLQLERPAEARADLQRLQANAPTDARTAYLAAMLAHREGRVAEARKSLATVTKRLDRLPLPLLRATPQLLLLNGLAHMALDEAAQAVPYLEAHHDLIGGSAAARVLAQCLVAQGRGDRAIAVLQAQLRRQPDDSASAALQVRLLVADQHLEEAIRLGRRTAEQANSAELQLAVGLALAAKGDGEGAQAALEAALKLQPGHAEARQALAGVLLHNGQVARATTLAQAAAKARPADPAAQRMLGDAARARGDGAAARQAYALALKLAPDDAASVLALARLDRREGALDRAEQALAKRLQQADARHIAPAAAAPAAPAASGAGGARPDRVRDTGQAALRALAVELAQVHEQRGRGAEAQRLYERMAAAAPGGDPRPALLLADFQVRQGQGATALATLRALPPDHAEVQWHTARARMAVGDTVGARQALVHAARLAAQDADLQVRVAGAQLQLGDAAGAAYSLSRLEGPQALAPAVLTLRVRAEIARPDLAAAEALVGQAQQRWPKAALAPRLRAELALARRDPAAAVQAMERAMKLEPTTEQLLGLFGALAARDGAAAALPLLERWLQQQPRDWLARNALSEAYVRLGRFKEAQQSYQAQLALAAPTPAVRHNLAVVMLQNGDAQALAQAEQALSGEPGNPRFQATAGWAALQAGQSGVALSRLRAARAQLPDDPTIRYYLASALHRAQRTEEARTELAAALNSPQAFDEREDAKRLAAQLGALR